jgi:hypothetical protein
MNSIPDFDMQININIQHCTLYIGNAGHYKVGNLGIKIVTIRFRFYMECALQYNDRMTENLSS